MVGRFLALIASLAIFIAVTSVPLLRHDKYAAGRNIKRVLPEEEDEEDTPENYDENHPKVNPKAIKDKSSETKIITNRRCTRYMCPSGYGIADGYEGFDCTNMIGGCTWKDCCVLDSNAR